MTPEKTGDGARRHGGAGRGKSKPVERAAGKDAAPGLTLVDIDPWGAFFEKFWEQPEEGHAGERGGERDAGARRPATKPRPRRARRSS